MLFKQAPFTKKYWHQLVKESFKSVKIYHDYFMYVSNNHILDKGEGILCHSTISLAVSQRNQDKEKTSQYT